MKILEINLIFISFKLIDAVRVNVPCTKEVTETWHHMGLIRGCYSGTGDVRDPSTLVFNPDDVVSRPMDTKTVGIAFYPASRVFFIPRGLKSTFIALRALYFNDQPMETIRERELRQFGSNLEYFHVEGGQLIYLTRDPFRHNPNMKTIKIAGSFLVSIEPEFFENLPRKLRNLQEIQMLKNPCINQRKVKPNIDQIWRHNCVGKKPREFCDD